jgi:hypothetical protein
MASTETDLPSCFVCVGEKGRVGKQERKKGHLEDVSTNGRIIVERLLKDRIEGVDFIDLTQDGGYCEYSNVSLGSLLTS